MRTSCPNRVGPLGAALLALGLVACGRTDGAFLGAPVQTALDAGQTVEGDAGLVAPDAGVGRDAGAPPEDLGQALARAMSCDLDDAQALRAAARFVACADVTTMPAVMDMHEGFGLGSMEPYASESIGLPAACGVWQCAARASTCLDFVECFMDTALAREPCVANERSCHGDTLGVCAGPFVSPHLDCARLGARCEDGACVREGCRFGNGETSAVCSADRSSLELCGIYSVDCTSWRGEPATCASFYVGGEAPVPWCSPADVGNAAGAYSRPVQCDRRGVVSFQTMSGRTHRLDCVAEGYRGCDERGCRG